MCRLSKNSGQDTFKCHVISVVILALSVLSRRSSLVSAIDRIRPSRQDFAICELSAAQKENFLDEHNKFRGKVDPPAADMEYLVSIVPNFLIIVV